MSASAQARSPGAGVVDGLLHIASRMIGLKGPSSLARWPLADNDPLAPLHAICIDRGGLFTHTAESFYLGVPVQGEAGTAAGVLYAVAGGPGQTPPTASQREAFREIGATLAAAMTLADERQSDSLADIMLGHAERLSGVGSWRFEHGTGRVIWSPTVWAIHGLQPVADGPSLEQAGSLVLDEDLDHFRTGVVSEIPEGEMRALSYRIRRASDQEIRWLSATVTHVRDKVTDRRVTLGICRDITDERNVREALTQREAHFRHLAESVSDLVSSSRPTGEFTYVSPSALTVLGYSPGELVGKPAFSLIHPDDQAAFIKAMEPILASTDLSAVHKIEYRCVRKDGEIIWVEASPRARRDPVTGQIVEVLDVSRDITARKKAEAALSEREEQYRLLAEGVTDVIARYDQDGLLSYVSPSSVQMFGYAPEELVGRHTWEIIHPDDRKLVAAQFADLMRGGGAVESGRIEYRARRKSGDILYVEAHPRILRDPETGEVIGFQDVVRDVSERKIQELKLRESEARFRQMAEQMSDVLLQCDIDGIITYISPSCSQLGYSVADLTGRAFTDLAHPEDLERTLLLVRRIIRGQAEAAELIDQRLLTAAGEWAWVEGRPTITSDEQGRMTGLVVVMRVVTARKQAEARAAAALAASEAARWEAVVSDARYQMLEASVRDLTIQIARDGTLLYASPAIRQFGYEPEEVVGKSSLDLVHPDDVQEVVANQQADLAAGYALPGKERIFRYRTKSGSYVWLEGAPAVNLDEHGQPFQIINSLRDVTERKALEESLIAARMAAEAAAAAKSEFLANMSHELRTPLTSVIGFSQLLQGAQDLPDGLRRYADRIVSGGKALLTTINDVLDFSKLEAGDFVIDAAPADPGALLEEVIDLLSVRVEGKDVSLSLGATSTLPATLLFDANRVRQVLLNLVGNAVKFTDEGSVTVAADYDAADEMLTVRVTDTGPGIAEDQRARLFHRFSQVDGSISRRHGGTGLGLAISKGLVEAMGGSIGVDSTPGEGSVFWFRIPAPRSHAAGQETEETASLAPLNGCRVLIVDDCQQNQELVRQILVAFEADVEVASTGQAGVNAALARPFDVILMDMRMPGMDGVEATGQIRSRPGPNRHVPILLFSADGDAVLSAHEGLFDGRLLKPVVPAALLATIVGVLDEDPLAAAGLAADVA